MRSLVRFAQKLTNGEITKEDPALTCRVVKISIEALPGLSAERAAALAVLWTFEDTPGKTASNSALYAAAETTCRSLPPKILTAKDVERRDTSMRLELEQQETWLSAKQETP